jgi:hypothetical protein
MSAYFVNTQDVAALDLGLSRARLEALTWEEIRGLRGWDRTRLLATLDDRGIQVHVRANPGLLKQFNVGRGLPANRPLSYWLASEESLIDGEWRPMKASRAMSLYMAAFEDATLGAGTMTMGIMDDGHGGKMAIPVPVPATEGLLEFAMPVEQARVLLDKAA